MSAKKLFSGTMPFNLAKLALQTVRKLSISNEYWLFYSLIF